MMSATYAPRPATAPFSALRLGALFLLLLMLAVRAFAGQVTLAWDPSLDTAVTGYSLYYGQTSGNLATKIDAGSQTTSTVTNLTAGQTYYFAVKARNASGTESAFSNQVSAVVPPAAPTASFTSSVTAGVAPLAVTFTSTSTGATTYSWAFGDNTTGTGPSTTHTYSAAGTYAVTLTATGSGGSSMAGKTITVSTPAAPVANFTPLSTSGTTPVTVNFTSTSTGTITGYSWTFGNGSTSTFQNPSYTYSTAGTYPVSLTVTGPGGTSTKSGTMMVTAAAATTPATNQAPNGSILSPNGNQTIQAGSTVRFQGAGSDPDGNTPLSYSWAFGTGTGAAASSSVQNPGAVTFNTAGTYTVKLTTKDAKGLSDPTPATVTVTVTAPPSSSTSATQSIWPATAKPTQGSTSETASANLGVKFKSDVNGYVSGIRFYKSGANTGTHIAALWTLDGRRLATATFTNETASGWQQVNFPTPVAITANTVYVASYFAPRGAFAIDQYYFSAAGTDSGVLHAPRDGVSGGNGVYAYSSGMTFPQSSYRATNYWVDIVFTPGK